jgi:hypothetical protein
MTGQTSPLETRGSPITRSAHLSVLLPDADQRGYRPCQPALRTVRPWRLS